MSIYRVIDIQTGNVMGTFKTLRRAYRKVDVLDNQYGGYRFTVRSVETRNCDICGETGILPSDKHVHLSESTKSMHDANCGDPDLLQAAKDALECLKRLPDVDGAYRVTCIHQLRLSITKAEETR